MTAPRKSRDLWDDLVEIRATCARIGKGYVPAYDYPNRVAPEKMRTVLRQRVRDS